MGGRGHGLGTPRLQAAVAYNPFLIGLALDPLMLVMPFLITARAVSHAIQRMDRYYEEFHKCNWHKRRAIVASFAEMFVPTFSGITTDALGVLVILLVPVVMLQKLAITASWWILAVTVSEMLMRTDAASPRGRRPMAAARTMSAESPSRASMCITAQNNGRAGDNRCGRSYCFALTFLVLTFLVFGFCSSSAAGAGCSSAGVSTVSWAGAASSFGGSEAWGSSTTCGTSWGGASA